MSRSHEEEQNDHECELAAWELLREAKAKIEELKTQLGDAKATADLWIQRAKHADEAAADLKADLAETKRHWKEETEEQARLLGMSAERECDLRGKLERERALAEQRGRLYDTAIRQLKALQVQVDELNNKLRYIEVESSHNWQNRERDRDAIAKWKEARSE